MPGKTDFQSKILKLVGESDVDKRGTKTVIRVIQWSSNGKTYKPTLEKREFYQSPEGDWKQGKAKGFLLSDLEAMAPVWLEILAALGSRLPEHAASQEAPKAAPAPTAAPANAPADPVFSEDF